MSEFEIGDAVRVHLTGNPHDGCVGFVVWEEDVRVGVSFSGRHIVSFHEGVLSRVPPHSDQGEEYAADEQSDISLYLADLECVVDLLERIAALQIMTGVYPAEEFEDD